MPTTDPEFLAKAMRARIANERSVGSCRWCIHFHQRHDIWCDLRQKPPFTTTPTGFSTCELLELGDYEAKLAAYTKDGFTPRA